VKPFPSPTSNTRINTRMSHDHRTIHTSVHTVLYDCHTTNTVSYDRHTTNTVQIRIIHGQARPDTVSSSVQTYSTRTQQKTQLPAATLKKTQSTCYIMHNNKSIILTKHDPSVEPFSCPNLPPCLPSRLLAKIISMSISLIMISNSLILSSAIFITSLLKFRKFMKLSHQNESIYIKIYTNV
jgi:hypothetical protein